MIVWDVGVGRGGVKSERLHGCVELSSEGRIAWIVHPSGWLRPAATKQGCT